VAVTIFIPLTIFARVFTHFILPYPGMKSCLLVGTMVETRKENAPGPGRFPGALFRLVARQAIPTEKGKAATSFNLWLRRRCYQYYYIIINE
jgi:hypothetical protein